MGICSPATGGVAVQFARPTRFLLKGMANESHDVDHQTQPKTFGP